MKFLQDEDVKEILEYLLEEEINSEDLELLTKVAPIPWHDFPEEESKESWKTQYAKTRLHHCWLIKDIVFIKTKQRLESYDSNLTKEDIVKLGIILGFDIPEKIKEEKLAGLVMEEIKRRRKKKGPKTKTIDKEKVLEPLKQDSKPDSEKEDNQKEKPKCLKCRSNAQVVKYGKYDTKAGKKQKWICKKCKEVFIEEKDKTRCSEEIREKAIMLYREKGESSREIAEILKKEDGIEITHKTILNWLKSSREGKMKRHAWGLFNNKGKVNYRIITIEIKKKFGEPIDQTVITGWIEKEIERRGGKKCGDMKCFGDPKQKPDEKPEITWCAKGMSRMKNQYICEEKI